MTGRACRPLMLLCAVCLGMAAGGSVARAQSAEAARYTLVLRGVPLGEALEALVQTTRIDLVYTSDLVAGQHAYCTGREAAVEELLRCVLAGSGLDYVRSSSGAYVLIEAVHQPPRYGTLAGSIVDAATGTPLPYANVLLADAATGTTTNEDGLFSVASLVSGRHRVMVTYVGYEPMVDSVWVTAGAQRRLRIALHPQAQQLAPVVVDGLTQRLPSGDLGVGRLDGRQPGAFGQGGTPDVVRGASALTGIAVQQPLADLHIQGGAAGEHLVLLDGVPVRDPVSLGRHLGAFSPLALGRLTAYKAGFGVEQGSHLSGVIAVEHDVTGGAGHYVAASADPVSLNGRVQAPFTLGPQLHGAAMAAVRTSLWSLYRDPGVSMLLRDWNAVDPMLASLWVGERVTSGSLGPLRQRPDVAFSDAHGALRLHLNPFHVLHASAYRARNQLGSELAAVNMDAPTGPDHLILTQDDYDWTNWAAQVRHSWLLGARSVVTTQAQGSWHASRYGYLALHQDVTGVETAAQLEATVEGLRPGLAGRRGSDEHNEIRELSVRTALSHSLAHGHQVDAALAAAHVASRFRLGNPFVAPFTHEARAWELTGAVQDRLSLGLRTTLTAGLRLAYLPERRTLYTEPRLALRYDREHGPLGPYALRLAGGLYRQYTNQFELTSSGSTNVVPSILFWLPVDRSLAPPRVYHLAADVLLMPHPRWTVTLEAYHKHQPRLLVTDYVALLTRYPAVRPTPPPRPLAQADFISPARGRAYGGDARVQYHDARLDARLTYGYSRAERTFPGRFDGAMQPAPWNAPHRLAVDTHLTLTDALALDVNGRAGWGRRWAFRRAYYDYLVTRLGAGAFAPFDLEQPADAALPADLRLDAGVTYTWRGAGAAVELRAYVANLLDRRNVYDRSLEQTAAGTLPVARTLPGRYPVLALRVDY